MCWKDVITDSTGSFTFQNVPFRKYTLDVTAEHISPLSKEIDVTDANTNLGIVKVQQTEFANNDDAENIPTVSLSDEDVKTTSSTGVASVLSASGDAFTRATTFVFSVARFRLRSYDDENFITLMNSAPMTDLVTGRTMYNSWSGLNDVMRSRETTLGLAPATYSYGSVGGVYSIDSRASHQRKQLQASFSLANRSYENRFMITYGSGVMKGGWAVSLSYSRRWAEEGYVPGTFYDGHSYFASIEKFINSKHSLALTAFGAPTKNGRAAAAVKEMYVLSGSHYYNPDWGYQDGKKRNAVVGDNNRPVIILTHEWNISATSSLESAVSYSFGKNKVSGLDWYNATDPRPDYYRKLPSYVLSSTNNADLYQQTTTLFTNNENVRQIDWDHLYDVNYHTGDTARYVVSDRVTDSRIFSLNTIYNKIISDKIIIYAGATYQMQQSEYFNELKDLLGGSYFVNLNQFADQTIPGNMQNDLNNPNRHIYEGDKYNHDYKATVSRTSGWAQGVLKYNKVDFFAVAQLASTSFYRTGEVRNGVFSDNSLGDSEKESFFNYAFKGGVTYKINGRNYLFANGSMETRAPNFEDAFISPRTQNTLAPELENEKVSSVEGGYFFKAPRLKIRAVGYLSQFNGRTKTAHFYNDDFHTFVNYTVTGVNIRSVGTELSAEAALGKGFSAGAVAALGQYFFTDRAKATITQDNRDTVLALNETVYATNLHVGGSPENAYTVGLFYRSKDYWFVGVNANYFDNIYIGINPARRTLAAIELVDEGSSLRNEILSQEKVKGQFTLDVSAGWSWKINNKFKGLNRNTYLVLNVGVNNILDNTDFITNGFEQLRFDFIDKNVNKFAPKYYYALGTNFFASLTLRLN